jgi:ribosome maturation factor RimP
MGLEQQISTLAEGKLINSSHFVVDVVVSARKGPKKVLVIIDGDNGVSIDACASLSRELSMMFDELAFFEDAYTLEVSTPGVDYPLKMKRQYHKHIGRKVRVKMGEKTIEGKLEAVGEDTISLQEESGSGKMKQTISTAIDFSQIEKAFVLVSFK